MLSCCERIFSNLCRTGSMSSVYRSSCANIFFTTASFFPSYLAKVEEMAESELEVIDASGYKPRRIPSADWRECIKKIWEVDPLECPNCRTEMKIISFITDRQVIQKILSHLHLWESRPARSPPARAGPELSTSEQYSKTVDRELYDDGWPGYEEPFITYD